jgi:hypothetical protein
MQQPRLDSQKEQQKKELIATSQMLKNAREMCLLGEEYNNAHTINEMLKIHYGIDEETNTFAGWKKQGFFVKKGSKSFKFWSKPLRGKKKGATKVEASEDKDEEKGYKFFAVAYVFTKSQVEKKED